MNLDQSNSYRKSMSIVALIVFASLLLKLCIFKFLAGHQFTFEQPDSGTYITPAIKLVQGHGFFSNQNLWERTPGYPLFLASIFYIFGYSIKAIILVQLALTSVLVIYGYFIANLFAKSRWVALVAAGLIAFNLLIIGSTILVLSDLLCAVLMAPVFYHALHMIVSRTITSKMCLFIGVLIAVATLVRPVIYYIPLLLVIIISTHLYRSNQLRKNLKYLIYFILPFLILVGGWQIRNKAVIGTFQYTNIDAINLYLYYAADDLAHARNITFNEAATVLSKRAKSQKFTNSVDQSNYYRREGFKIVLAHPVLSIQQFFVGMPRTLIGFNHSLIDLMPKFLENIVHVEIDQHDDVVLISAFSVLIYLFNLLVLGLCFYAFWMLAKNPNYKSSILLLCCVMGYFILVSSNACSTPRFRLPLEVIAQSFALIGYGFLYEKIISRKKLAGLSERLIT